LSVTGLVCPLRDAQDKGDWRLRITGVVECGC